MSDIRRAALTAATEVAARYGSVLAISEIARPRQWVRKKTVDPQTPRLRTL